MRKSLTTAALVALATGTILVGAAGPAAATDDESSDNCRTVTTHLTDRPDSGVAGNDWANDDIKRTVKICEWAAAEGNDGLSTYTAEVTDTGTFTTVAGTSPSGKGTVPAGVTGYLAGGFNARFTAVAHFETYQGNFDGETYSGDEPSTTTDWVKNVWGGSEDFHLIDNLILWKWTYWTCNCDLAKAGEKWVNADADVNEGDITGTPCTTPTTTPTTNPTTTPSTPATGVPTTSPAAAPGGTAGGGTSPALPVTGSSTGVLAGLAVVLLAVGGALFAIGRRRRRFIA